MLKKHRLASLTEWTIRFSAGMSWMAEFGDMGNEEQRHSETLTVLPTVESEIAHLRCLKRVCVALP